jgi:hypothetical protein
MRGPVHDRYQHADDAHYQHSSSPTNAYSQQAQPLSQSSTTHSFLSSAKNTHAVPPVSSAPRQEPNYTSFGFSGFGNAPRRIIQDMPHTGKNFEPMRDGARFQLPGLSGLGAASLRIIDD